MRFRRFAVALLPFAFTACLSGTDYSSNPYPNVPIEQTTFASSLNVNLAQSTKTASGLYFREVTPGTGAAVTGTSTVQVYYEAFFVNGTRFDKALSPNDPPLVRTLGLTPPQLIKGFEEGLVGMKVGGTRQLIVPPELAYGSGGFGAVPPNAVLVFTVTLVSIQ